MPVTGALVAAVKFQRDFLLSTSIEGQEHGETAQGRKIGECEGAKGQGKGRRKASARGGSSKTIADPPSDREADLARAPKWQPRYPGSGGSMARSRSSPAATAVSAVRSVRCSRAKAPMSRSYLDNRADAIETAAIVEAEGRRAIAIKADVGKVKSGEKIAAQTVAKLGLDILVNNAGEQHPRRTFAISAPSNCNRLSRPISLACSILCSGVAAPQEERRSSIAPVTMYQGRAGSSTIAPPKARSLPSPVVGENLVDRVSASTPPPRGRSGLAQPRGGAFTARSRVSGRAP